jgi:3-oxoacyl-(acyl-carrier-protein) synthase
MKIFITGYGCVSAIGLNVKENFESLCSKRTGIQLGKKDLTSNWMVGEIVLTNEEIMSNYAIEQKISRTALLGIMAASEAFEGKENQSDVRTGLISGTSVGGIDLTENEYKKFLKTGKHNVSVYSQHDSGLTSQHIAKQLKISGFINTISTACSSAANAIMMGARMIENGLLDRVVVGGTDSLAKFTISGFNSLMIYNKEWCKPFDLNRNGLNLGEGAGFLVLESETSINKTKSNPLAILSGWNNASDAYHQTASSPDGYGSTLSMNAALKKANLKATQIDYINAHGTGTQNNDLSESVALKNVFTSKIPAFSSTKSYTGHTLAASAGIEAVYSILALKNKVIFPNLNFKDKIEETNLTPETEVLINQKVQHVLSNAFGFGGNNSSLIFSENN